MRATVPRAGGSGGWIALSVLVLVLAMLPLIVGCKTQQSTEFSRTQIAGAIYDGVGRPIPGARIQIARRQAVSDNLGRFRVASLAPGTHPLSVTARAYEPHRSSIEVQSRTHFLRVQLHSITSLVAQAITYSEESAWDAAGGITDRLDVAAPDDPRTELLHQLIAEQSPAPEGATP